MLYILGLKYNVMKYCKAILDIQSNAFSKPLTFIISPGKDSDSQFEKLRKSYEKDIVSNVDKSYPIEIGSVVVVPFGKQLKLGFVVDIFDESQIKYYETFKNFKPVICAVSESFFNKDNIIFAKFLSDRYLSSFATCLRLFIPAGCKVKLKHIDNKWYVNSHRFRETNKNLMQRYFTSVNKDAYWENFLLSKGQQYAIDQINASIKNSKNDVYLLDGVTGSGKTEVYLRSIQYALSKNKTALVMVPEISLTPQTVSRFQERFPGQIAVIHSKMTNAERHNQFQMIKSGIAKVVIGPRSSLFSPLKNIGIIVMDEEHSLSYKQDNNPRYSTRACVKWLSKQQNITVVLGSATPSLESIYDCNINDNWHLLLLPERTNKKPMPKIDVVDMSKEFKNGSKNMFSKKLQSSLLDELKNGNKVILFHNRRGFSNYMFCRNCGFVPTCQNCSTKLTFHQFYKFNNQTGQMLVCHHCGYTENVPITCPECDSPYIAKYGAGTQSVEENLEAFLHENNLDNVNLVRMDADTTKQKDGHNKCLKSFAEPGPAILLGTQMIAKGLDFSEVTLVGIVLIDTNLSLPDFRSSERTFDLILQVAGRCGRGELPGNVIVQTYQPEEECIECASEYNKELFIKIELNKRRLLNYPPYSTLANITISGKDEVEIKEKAYEIQLIFEDHKKKNNITNVDILPSTSCVIEKIRSMYRYHILLKSSDEILLSKFIGDSLSKYKLKSRIRLVVDVDPFSLL